MKARSLYRGIERAGPILAVAAGFLWIAFYSIRPLSNYDLWWHLATGRYIGIHGHIPRVDPFSSTSLGSRWINRYWMYEVLLYKLYGLFGYGGIIALKVGLLLAIFAVLYIRVRPAEIGRVTAGLAVAVTFWMSRPAMRGWDEEASLVSLLGVSLLLMHLNAVDEKRKSTGTLWIWAPLFALWSNTHPGFVIGLVLAGIFSLGYFFDNARSFGRVWMWLLTCALATLLNPNGIDIYRIYLAGDRSTTVMQANQWTGFLPHEWYFWIIALLLWFSLLHRIRRGERLPYGVYGTALGLSSIAIRHNICVPFLMIFAIPLLVEWARRMRLFRWVKQLERPWLAPFCLLAALSVIALSARSLSGRPLGVNRLLTPVEACDFIQREELTQHHFYNEFRFGGYWIWRFNGSPPVFFDSRYPTVEGYIPLVSEFIARWEVSPRRLQEMFDRFKVDAALLGYKDIAPTVQDLRFPRRQWALVYWDDTSLIYLKRTPFNAPWIRRWEVSGVYPDIDPDQFVEDVRKLGPREQWNVRKALQKNLDIHPDSFRARILLSAIPAGKRGP